MIDIFPWQQKQWQRLSTAFNNGQLHHAILFTGMPGIGKFDFAKALAKRILCERAKDYQFACGQCKSCHLVASKSHPDLALITPVANSQVIKVEQVRDLIGQSQQSAHRHGYKIWLLYPAHAMNITSANALLKTLEEPSYQKTLLILVSHLPTSLPATIRSRCMNLRFQPPAKLEAMKWLQQNADGIADADLETALSIADGAPLLALSYAKEDYISQLKELGAGLLAVIFEQADPVTLANQWQKQELHGLLQGIWYWLTALIHWHLKSDTERLDSTSHALLSAHQQQTLNIIKLFGILDQVKAATQGMISKINFNQQLILERILIACAKL